MLEQTISNQVDKVSSQVIQPGMQEVPLAYLVNIPIPESIKHFFDQEVETWLTEEDERISSNDRFDYDRPEVRLHIDQLIDTLKQGAAFDQQTFHRILERAIKLEANYLLKPHQTLTQFIFKNSNTVTTIEVYNTLKYFFRLTYYKEALTDYFNQKYLQEINTTQFAELIDEIDRRAFESDPVGFALSTIKVLLDFYRETTGDSTADSLSSKELQQAFADRKLDAFSDLMARSEAEGHTELNLESLETILRQGKTPAEMASAEASVAEPRQEEIISLEDSAFEFELEDIDVSQVTPPPSDEADVEEELEEELEDDDEYEEDSAETAAESRAGEVVEAEPTDVPPAAAPTETTSKAGAQLADVLASNIGDGMPLQNLLELIPRRDYKRYLKRLFKRDEAGFKSFIAEINDYRSWQEASVAIDDEFYHRGVNPYAKEAIAFTDICYKRFFPKDKMGRKAGD
jgi:hypothetical protein